MRVRAANSTLLWVLLALLPFQWLLMDPIAVVQGEFRGVKLNSLVPRKTAVFLRMCFTLRYFVLPLYLYPSWHTLLCRMAGTSFGAFYLGMFFIISHNFEGLNQKRSSSSML